MFSLVSIINTCTSQERVLDHILQIICLLNFNSSSRCIIYACTVNAIIKILYLFNNTEKNAVKLNTHFLIYITHIYVSEKLGNRVTFRTKSKKCRNCKIVLQYKIEKYNNTIVTKFVTR